MTSPNCKSLRNCLSQKSSQLAKAIAQYSLSALDLVTTLYFVLFQEIKLPPIETQYPKVIHSSSDSMSSNGKARVFEFVYFSTSSYTSHKLNHSSFSNANGSISLYKPKMKY